MAGCLAMLTVYTHDVHNGLLQYMLQEPELTMVSNYQKKMNNYFRAERAESTSNFWFLTCWPVICQTYVKYSSRERDQALLSQKRIFLSQGRDCNQFLSKRLLYRLSFIYFSREMRPRGQQRSPQILENSSIKIFKVAQKDWIDYEVELD